jgi:hypothetical protein
MSKGRCRPSAFFVLDPAMAADGEYARIKPSVLNHGCLRR